MRFGVVGAKMAMVPLEFLPSHGHAVLRPDRDRAGVAPYVGCHVNLVRGHEGRILPGLLAREDHVERLVGRARRWILGSRRGRQGEEQGKE